MQCQEKWQKILQREWSVISAKRLIRKITKTGLILTYVVGGVIEAKTQSIMLLNSDTQDLLL